MLVFITSCFGEGEPTDNAKDFYNWLLSPSRTEHLNTKFTVFGLGNSTYGGTRYQAVGRNIDKRMAELGAQRIFERGEGDDSKRYYLIFQYLSIMLNIQLGR